MSFNNNGFSGSPISASRITGFFDATLGVLEEIGTLPGGGAGLLAVATSGSNFGGNGQEMSPLYLNDVITVTDVHTNNLSASNQVTASSLKVVNSINAGNITASFKGNGSQITDITTSSFPNWTNSVRDQLSAGANLNYSAGKFALNSSVTGVLNIESTRVSGTSVSASQLIIIDENTNDEDFQYFSQNYSYPFSIYSKDVNGWFSNIKATGSLPTPSAFGGAFGLDIRNNSGLDYANAFQLYTLIQDQTGNINQVYNLYIFNGYYNNDGIINTSSLVTISDLFYYPGNEQKRNNIINNYGLHLYPLEVGVNRYPLYLENQLDSTREIIIDNSGNLGLGTKNTTKKLNVVGHSAFTGSVCITSNLTASTITGTFNGNGQQITNITASNIPNWTTDVRSQFSAGTNINITNGVISTINVPTRSEVTGAFSTITAANATNSVNAINAQTASYLPSGSGIPTFTNDVRNQLSAGANLNYSAGQFALNANVNTTSVTASFNGNGSKITNITASNISNWTTDVRSQFTAGQNIGITNGVVSVTGTLPITNGGTGLNTIAAAGNILISNGSALVYHTMSQDVSMSAAGVATVTGLQTVPVSNAAPTAGYFLKYGGTNWFAAPVAATVPVGSLTLTSDPIQTITANGQIVLPTSSYHRIAPTGNYNSAASNPINFVGATLGQILFIQVPVTNAFSFTFTKGVGLALGSNTRKISSGGSLQLIYDGTQWVEMFFNTSTSV